MKNPKTTVKYKLLKLMKGKGVVKRKDLCLLIFKAQGKTGKEAQTYRPGYYGNNLQDWVRQGFLVQPKGGGYKIGKAGVEYLQNPELIEVKLRLKRSQKRLRSVENWNDQLRQELADERAKVRDIIHIANR